MRQGRRRSLSRRLAVVTGFALTLSACTAVSASAHQSMPASCPGGPVRIACVDLSHQVMWVQSHGRTTWGPVHIRSGAPATPTRTGLWHIYLRGQQHRSTIDGEPMPYSQFFDGGRAFHGTFTRLASPPGSLGCVTMTVPDAAGLWRVMGMGDPVYVFGHRPHR
jgi:lipoprotein-anchoring transpeptidase ErfK/SrfK